MVKSLLMQLCAVRSESRAYKGGESYINLKKEETRKTEEAISVFFFHLKTFFFCSLVPIVWATLVCCVHSRFHTTPIYIMDFYAKCQIQQLAPVLVLCPGEGPHLDVLRRYFDAVSVADKVWDSSMLKNRLVTTKYIVNYGTDEALVYANIQAHRKKRGSAHSALSPFNAASDIFPNGILSTKWFQKYVSELPFVVICVYKLADWSSSEDLGAALESARVRYAEAEVRFVGIVVSEGNDDSNTERMAELRQISGLARMHGLFFVNTATLERDCELVVSTLVNNLKSSAVDFYSAVEHRVKQRYRKYYTFPEMDTATRIPLGPKFLEIRNLIKQAMLLELIHPHNVELGLSTLEHAYEGLIALLRECMPEFVSPSISKHDITLYCQFRNLLDILAVHLIRGYFSIEEPVAALRKHEAHIANVVDATLPLSDSNTAFTNNLWLSIQYQWLAELMAAVPESALTDLYKITKGKNKSNQKSVSYYGGITFHDKFYLRVVTRPDLLFLKAADYLEGAEIFKSPLVYLQICSDQEEMSARKVSLLKRAQQSISSAKPNSEGKSPFNSLTCLIDWHIAEEYMAKKDYEKAVSHYQLCLKQETWGSVTELVIQRIIAALTMMEDSETYLRSVAQLSLLKLSHPVLLPQFPLGTEYEIKVDDGQFLNIDLFVFDKSLKNETHAFDTVVTQLVIQSNFSFSLLKALFPNSVVEFFAESVTISLSGGHEIKVPRGESTDKLTVLKAGEAANLDDLNDGRIVQIEDEVTEPGPYEVLGVTVDLRVKVRAPKVTVVFIHSETHTYDSLEISHSAKIFEKRDDATLSKAVRLDSRSRNKITVLPYRPEVQMKMSFPFSTIIVGEKLDVGFEISHKSPVHGMNFSLVSLQARTAVLENDTEKEDLPVQTNWELLKDDEPLNILDIVTSGQSSNRTLHMSVRKPPGTNSAVDNLRVILEVMLLVTESTGTVSVYEVDTYLLPIVMEPFGTAFSVSPKCSASGELDMANPFIVGMDPTRDYSMPLPARTWLATVNIADKLDLISLGDIEILNASISIKSKNAEILVNTATDPEQTNSYVKQLFVTRGKHGYSDRNVAVVSSALIAWCREGKDAVNHYETSEWEVVLPLQDPRIMLQVTQTNASSFLLSYTLENPTPRILTFTTTLTLDEAALQGSSWDFLDSRNLLPLKQLAFPVLPFSQHRIVYYGTCNVDQELDQIIQLPNLQAYDVNYKVSLPTLALDDSVTKLDQALFIKNSYTSDTH